MSSSAVLGKYLWHELLTTDPDAGAGFYAKVLGWNRFPYEGDPGYAMLGNEQGPVGGARVMGKDPLADKVGPNWLTYVGVPDLTAALATAEAKGGRVLHAVTAVPGDGGRYAVIADPQGAVIGLYEPGGGMSGDSAAPAGPAVWHELTAENPQAALQFYNGIFGWDVVDTHDMGGHVGTYYLFGKGTTQMGGAFIRSKDLPPTWPRWLVYMDVPSITAAVASVKAAGGKILNGPHQVPGGSWMAQVLDSHGVPLALHGPKEAAAAAPKAAPKPKAKPAAPKPKVAAKPKAKAKVKTKAKTKAKAKAKSKSRKAPKAKVAARRKGKVAVKSKTKAKPKARTAAKAKRKTKTKARSKARKAPRRGK